MDDGIVFDNYTDGAAIAAASGTIFNPVCDHSIARHRNGVLLGGSIFVNHTGYSIAMHVASFRPGWINRDLLYVTFHYPFMQLGVEKVFGQVPANNKKALEFDLNLGFKIEGEVKDVFPGGESVYILGMYRRDCRFLAITPRGIKPGA